MVSSQVLHIGSRPVKSIVNNFSKPPHFRIVSQDCLEVNTLASRLANSGNEALSTSAYLLTRI